MAMQIHVGEIVGDSDTYALHQVCAICGVHSERLVELVAFSIIEPTGDTPEAWRFSESAVRRAKKALRLQRDLDLDRQGLALVLDLLDEIDRLRAQLAGRPG